MTDTTVDAAVDAHDDDHHPSDLFYVKIAAILALFTGLEVGTYFIEDSVSESFQFISLTVLMVVKFAMVAAYFMHLKYDTPWFRRVFIAGLVLAISVYGIFLFTFDVFGLG
jgi:cytochrome c oxidase subunit 4